jgi:predicted metal-binding membrane protein
MYLTSLSARRIGGQVSGFEEWAYVGSSIVLIGVGLYRFSHWKGLGLTHCRSPLRFVIHGWRDGTLGAFRMGILLHPTLIGHLSI